MGDPRLGPGAVRRGRAARLLAEVLAEVAELLGQFGQALPDPRGPVALREVVLDLVLHPLRQTLDLLLRLLARLLLRLLGL